MTPETPDIFQFFSWNSYVTPKFITEAWTVVCTVAASCISKGVAGICVGRVEI